MDTTKLERHQKLIFLIVSFSTFLFGIYNLFIQIPSEPNTCQMTYTRGQSYTKVAHVFDRKGIPSAYEYKYNLYRFDQITERTNPSDDPLQVTGIPVLFIPGHLGDYKQVRSLGSLADEIGKHSARRLDYFSLDFREEPSAFSGNMLEQQATYVNDAVSTILRLYKQSSSALTQKSVVLVGHSMGGFVARRSLQLFNHQRGTIQTIVTLSSPHVRAPHAIDSSMTNMWSDTNNEWKLGRNFVLGRAIKKRNQELKEIQDIQDQKDQKKEDQKKEDQKKEEQRIEQEKLKEKLKEQEQVEEQVLEQVLEQVEEQVQEQVEEKAKKKVSKISEANQAEAKAIENDPENIDTDLIQNENGANTINTTNNTNSTKGWFFLSWFSSNTTEPTAEELQLKQEQLQLERKQAEQRTPSYQRARRAGQTFANITLISISGGRKDNLMDSNLATIKHLVFSDRGFSILTKDIPDVEVSIDHQCQVWCKQLLHAITSGLYASINSKSGRMSTQISYRMKAMSKYLLPKEWLNIRQNAAVAIASGQLPADYILEVHDHVHFTSNTSYKQTSTVGTTVGTIVGTTAGTAENPITTMVRLYGALILPITLAIVGLSICYQLYVTLASTSKMTTMPSFRYALSPERHLLHILVGTGCAWLLNTTKDAHTCRKKAGKLSFVLFFLLCLLSTPTVQLFWLTIGDTVSNTLPSFMLNIVSISVPSIQTVLQLSEEYPSLYIIGWLYCSGLTILYLLDFICNLLQSISTWIFVHIFQSIRNKMPNSFGRGIDKAISVMFGRYAMLLFFTLCWLFTVCVITPILNYNSKKERLGPSFNSLSSPSHLIASFLLTAFFNTYVLCIRAALIPKKQVFDTKEENFKFYFLRSFVILNVLLIPLQIPSTLIAYDVIRTSSEDITWSIIWDIFIWRLPCIFVQFLTLYYLIFNPNSESNGRSNGNNMLMKCLTESESVQMTTYKVGNETFQYPTATGPPPEVQVGMRLAYWRITQMKKLDDVFNDASTVRELLVEHTMHKVKDLITNGKPNQQEITKDIILNGQKVHTVLLGTLDKYQKMQIALDQVSSVPNTDNQPPCPVVKARRKAMQKEVIKQLKVGDELKKLTKICWTTLEKFGEKDVMLEKVKDVEEVSEMLNELPWPEMNVIIPEIPIVICPPIPSPDDHAKKKEEAETKANEEKVKDVKKKQEKNKSGDNDDGDDENDNIDMEAYYVADQFDILTGTMLVCLFFGLGFFNFLWNLTCMYRSLYSVSLFSVLLVIRYQS